MSLSAEEREVMSSLEMECAERILREEVPVQQQARLWNMLANRLYYAVFHAVSALLIKNSLYANSHKGLHMLFSEKFVRTGIFSLLYRSSEKAGILDYCKENGIDFWAYMVLEQGALSGKYDTAHPLPAGSQRGDTYNPLLPQIEKLVAAMRTVGDKYGITPAQVALAWAIAKGTTPIIGVTKPAQVQDMLEALKVILTDDEMKVLEETAENTGVDTRGAREMPMI